MRIKDWLFFPLIILVAGIMIYIASFGATVLKKAIPKTGGLFRVLILTG